MLVPAIPVLDVVVREQEGKVSASQREQEWYSQPLLKSPSALDSVDVFAVKSGVRSALAKGDQHGRIGQRGDAAVLQQLGADQEIAVAGHKA